jgi:ATP-dependent DNA helicase RecQ
LIQGKWKPDPAPQWVTAIPSRRHTELVRDFAERLAASLGLPFVPALRHLREAQPQKEMRSSTLQLRNVLRAYEVTDVPTLAPSNAAAAPAGFTGMFQRAARRVGAHFGNGPTLPPVPVLLVDDMVDSGWTLTLAAVLLQHHGSGPVYPFALAKASPRGS